MRLSPKRAIHVVTAVAHDGDVRYYELHRLIDSPHGPPTLAPDASVLHVDELAQAIAAGEHVYVMRRLEGRRRAALYRLALRRDDGARWNLEVSGISGAAEAVASLPRFAFVREAATADIEALQRLMPGQGADDTDGGQAGSQRLVANGWATRQGDRVALTAIGCAILARY